MIKTILLAILLTGIIVFIAFEIGGLIICRMETIEQLMIRHKVGDKLKKLETGDWHITEIDWFIMEKEAKGYSLYVEMQNDRTYDGTNDFILIDKNGEILRERLSQNIKFYDAMKNY